MIALRGRLILVAWLATMPLAATTTAQSGAPHSPDRLTADPSRLRIDTAGWATDFTRATIDLADLQSGGPPRDGIPPVDSPAFESIEAARTWLPGTAPGARGDRRLGIAERAPCLDRAGLPPSSW